MITQFGWTQSLKNWTISKNNNDTIITYNFTKHELVNLRVYVTKLEETSDLYKISKQQSIVKDSIIKNQSQQVFNRDSIITDKTVIITNQKLDLVDLNKWAKTQEIQKIKYQKRAAAIPYWLGSGGIIGIILCLILHI